MSEIGKVDLQADQNQVTLTDVEIVVSLPCSSKEKKKLTDIEMMDSSNCKLEVERGTGQKLYLLGTTGEEGR